MNRSVAAAQRRRAGPQNEARPQVQRPTPSIASAANFQQGQQSYPSQGQYQQQPPMSGHLAGQYADIQQKQYLSGQGPARQGASGQIPQQQQQQPRGKMSVPQAITLITLRLGRVESHLQDIEFQNLQTTSVNEDGTPNVSTSRVDVDGIYKELDFIKDELMPMKSDFSNIYKPVIMNVKNDCSYHSREILTIKSEMRELKYQINTLLQFMKTSQEQSSNSVIVEDVEESEDVQNSQEQIVTEVQDDTKENGSLQNLEASDIKELVKNALHIEINEVTPSSNAPTFSSISN